MYFSEASPSASVSSAAAADPAATTASSSLTNLPSASPLLSVHPHHLHRPFRPLPSNRNPQYHPPKSLRPYLSFLASHHSSLIMPPSPLPKIAIIGAGPAGLTLAAILTRHRISHTLYDADPSPTARNQGGTLDLHPHGAQAALRAAGLWEVFAQRARPESDVLKVVKGDGTVLWDGNVGADRAMMVRKKEESGEGKLGGRPEIDRGVLRELLLERVEVAWGRKVVRVLPEGREVGKWEVRFKRGNAEEEEEAEGGFDLVVGADGAWSRVRDVLTEEKPRYAGVVCVEVWAGDDVAARRPWMGEYVGEGSCFAFGEGRAIQAQRIGDGSIRTYACLRTEAGEGFWKKSGIDWERPEVARGEFVERFFGDWGGELKRLVLESEEQLVIRTLYQLPVGFSWESRPGVTLVGDAAHLMTPFAGVGVNAAMVDAMELGKGIVGFVESARRGVGVEPGGLAGVVKEYEAGLFPRGKAFAAKTAANMEKHFSETGSEDLVARLRAGYTASAK